MNRREILAASMALCALFWVQPIQAFVITGQVVDADLKPAAGVPVTLSGLVDQLVVTDKDGRFTATFAQQTGSPRRPYRITIRARDESRGLTGIASIEYPTDTVKITLRPAWTLKGRVVDPNQRGIPGARVLSGAGVETQTDSNGVFVLSTLPTVPPTDSQRWLFVDAPGFCRRQPLRYQAGVQAGALVDLGMIPLEPAVLSGVVVDANGLPAPAVSVLVRLWSPMGIAYSAITNHNGEFFVAGPGGDVFSVRAEHMNRLEEPGFLLTPTPARNVRVILGRNLWAEASLLGKPLPDIRQLSYDLAEFEADGKPILICFVDVMRERYRQLLTSLAGKTETLAAGRVVLIVVHCPSPISYGYGYQAFLKANPIPFPVHEIQDDVQRMTWCVKSFPWLVLADKEHIVRAEHLEIEKLEGMIDRLAR